MTTRRLLVTGRVQGVGFRDWTVNEARALGLIGWVRNRRDGSVEILAQGEADALDKFTERCRVGPRAAQVETVRSEAAQAEPSALTFECRPTV